MKYIEHLFQKVWLRRSIAFAWHLTGVYLCYLAAFEIRQDLGMDPENLLAFRETVIYPVIVFSTLVIIFKLYEGLWRFFTFHDCVRTALVLLLGTLIYALMIFIDRGGSFEKFPRLVFFINFILLLSWEVAGRGAIRLFREWNQGRKSIANKITKRFLLAGDVEECDAFIRATKQRGGFGKIVGILSEKRKHHGTRLHGVLVLGESKDIITHLNQTQAKHLIILPPYTGPRTIKDLVDRVASTDTVCDFRVLPSMNDITAGNVDVSNIRRVSIEDLLQRKPCQIDRDSLHSFVTGRKIMITGAGGSIGSEIARQILNLKPAALMLYDSSEFHLFEIERELNERAAKLNIPLTAIAGDVIRSDQMERAITEQDGVDVIYHAAAYKHVHLMEKNPTACFQNNVLGTLAVAEIAEKHKVKEFVLVSTDKAVRPTSLMGASKRLAERVVIERAQGNTKFKAVRFGNVLGSSGSVVPIFKKQIEQGGPVTVTTEEVTRYFMTIPEAVELVITAGAVAEDRSICVLEMGDPVKIETLARRMIKLSGFIPDVDIPIVYTGLRPGEKEYEELLTDDEDVARTEHDRIWVVKKSAKKKTNRLDIGQLIELIDEGDKTKLREFAHQNIQGSLLYNE